MSRSRYQPDQKRFVIFVGVAVLQFVLQVGSLTKGTEFIVSSLAFDDTFYYLQTAWNFKQLGVSTFDGINPTNGVQLIWFWIIVFLAFVSPTKAILLISVYVTSFFLNAICYPIIWKLAEAVQRPKLALYMASLWFFLAFGGEFYSMGMENSLHAVIFWVLIWQIVVFLAETNEERQRFRFITITILSILNVWTRLDAAIFSAILYIYCLIKFYKPENIKYVFLSGILAFLGLMIQSTTFYLMGGTFLPISSLVKQSWGGWESLLSPTTVRLTGALVLASVIEMLLYRYQLNKPERSFRGIWYCLLCGVILHVMLTSGFNAYTIFLWYLSPSLVFLAITFAVFADDFSQIMARLHPVVDRVILVGLCLPLILAAGLFFYTRVNHYIPALRLGYQAALWMSEQLPPEARVAS